MNQHKIIFSGPVGAGKTTAIASVSDVPPVKTEQRATDETRQVKANTTVAMDYGVIHLDGEKIHLYGTPGQERFDFMWDILAQGAIGLVLLISNARPEPFKDLDLFVDAFKPFADETRMVIGLTQIDRCASPSLEDYHHELQRRGLKVPVFEVDAREHADVSLLVQALLFCVDPQLELAGSAAQAAEPVREEVVGGKVLTA